MRTAKFLTCCLVAAAIMAFAGVAPAQFVKGDPAPAIKAQDIEGKRVDLDTIIQEGRDLVILFFFSVQTGEELALKLSLLDTRYGGEEIEIIALGFKEEETALKKFARDLDIDFYIINTDTIQDEPWMKKVDELPLTLLVVAQPDRTIERIIRGGGRSKAQILKEVAENFFQQQKLEAAADLAGAALQEDENDIESRELSGFILTAQGKLDDAEKEFGEIGSKTGLARVALEKGQYEEAVQLADEAGDGYAQAIKGEALLRTGQVDEASKVLRQAAEAPARDWQHSEAINAQGRVLQQQGNAEAAVVNYREAVALDPYNIVALSNEGAAHREMGDLESAQAALEKASQIRDDEMTSIMLAQVQRELREANDLKRREIIHGQIQDLSKRYEAMKEAGAKAADEWTTRPLVLAFLPSSRQTPVFFDRAGMDIVLQREIEVQLQADDRVSVVERSMLDQLLQELNLGSTEITSADTQRTLGRVLSAGLLGFIDFAQVGSDVLLYLRLVDTETTAITFQTSKPVDEKNPNAVVTAVIQQILDGVANGRELKGLIAEAGGEDAIIVNLGKNHGVKLGQAFTVYVDGDPIEVGGRVIAYRQKPVAKLEATSVEPEYAICKVTSRQGGVELAKEMKVKVSE